MLKKRLSQILKVLILFLMVPSYLHAYDFEDGGIYYNISGNSVSVTSGDTGYQGAYQGAIVIPSQVIYNGVNYKVTSIGDFAFGYCSNLTSVTIPNSVNIIEYGAFWQCSGISSINIPNSVTKIGSYTFYECSNLASIIIPNSVTELGKDAFMNCSGLKSVTISHSITSIETNTFYGCNNLVSINIPNSVTKIGDHSFAECSSLTSVTIPNSVTIIEKGAFAQCTNLVTVTIPNSVTIVGNGAFAFCENLVSFTFPNSVTAINEAIFQYCYSLRTVTIPNSITSIGRYAFYACNALASIVSEIKEPFALSAENVFPDGIYSKAVLTVPKGLKSAYQSIVGWKNFKNIVEEGGTIDYTLSIKSQGYGYATYNDTNTRNNTKTFTLNEGTSATITFSPDNGYRIKSVKVNSTDVTSSVSNNQYTISSISANTTLEVEFEAIPIPTYTLSVKATGNGLATYDGTTAKNNTKTFTLNEGTSATITFASDNGYRIKSVKVNSTDVTSSVSNNQFTISNIRANTTVEVEFEAIPVVINTYTLSVKAAGNGSATYNGTTAKNNTQSFTLNEGTSATITFAPDNGYRIKSVKVNSADVTSSVSNNSYTVSNIKANTMVEVEFEAIPVVINTYTLSVKAAGNGSATYNGTIAKNNTQSFTLNEGTSATITFAPDNGYRIKSVKVNNADVTSNVSNNSYTVSNIKANTTVEVEFEVIPPTTYTLSITVSGNGSASYSETKIVNTTLSFTLNEGTNATITFSPDNGHQIKSVKVNNTDVTSSVSNNQYTINNINANTTVEVEFEAIPVNTYLLEYVVDGETYKTYEIDEGAAITPEAEPTKEGYSFSGWSEIPATMPDHDVTVTGTFTKMESEMSVDDINYEVVSFGNHTVVVTAGDYGQTLEVPETIEYGNNTWTVMGVKDGALDKCESLAAVIWNPSIGFNARASNPNLLLYVKDKAYASLGVNNVVVNGTAENIELRDALGGNDFYCPKSFKAKKISYSHRYNMETGLGDSKGWETIVLPFDVQKYTSPQGEIVPFTNWAKSENKKPFWLFELTSSGYKDVEGIKANTPYIISMPNNPQYLADYVIVGIVTFSAENVEVKASDEMLSGHYQDRTFTPNYTNREGDEYLALNVNNYYVTNPSTEIDGSKFIRGLRAVHPFEAYMTTTDNTRSIDVMEGMTTAIRGILMVKDGASVIKVYDTRGVLMKTATSMDDVWNGLKAGVYIVNGKKMIIK